MTPDHPHDSDRTAQEAVPCPWAVSDPLYRQYHDLEWGAPCITTGRCLSF